MDELFGILCALTIVLAVVTLVGHGLWVMLAALIRAASGKPRAKNEIPRTSTPLDDARASIRQINHLHRRGQITDRLHTALIKMLHEEESRLMRGAPFVTLPAEEAASAADTPSMADAPAAPPAAPDRDTVITAPAALPSASTADTQSLPQAEPMFDAVVVPDEQPAPAEPAVAFEWQAGATPAEPRASMPPVQPAPALAAMTAPATPQPTELPRLSEPAPPQRTFADLMQAFMEQRNIRWGELLGGMAIVLCSIGLVISLWATLRQSFRYLPAAVFLAVTAGIFGAGMYTLRKWKLESTSRGLLIISVLLVPLNFLAAIAVSTGQSQFDMLYLLAVSVGLAAYGAITYAAGRVLVPHNTWALLAAVMGPSAGQLLIDRNATAGMPVATIHLLFALPLGCFLAGTLVHLVLIRGRWWAPGQLFRERTHMSARLATETFLLLGMAVFALVMPLALLAYKSGAIRATLADLAPALTTVAAIVLGFGLAVHQRVTRPKWARFRATGTGVSLFGGLLMLMLLLLVWPEPIRLVVLSLLVFAVLTALAIASRLPVLHAPAVVSLALAVLLGFYLFTGELPDDGTARAVDVIGVFVLSPTSVVLSIVAAAFGGLAWQLRRHQRHEDAWGVLWGVGPVAAVGLLSALVAGFQWRSEAAGWPSLVLIVGAMALLLQGGCLRRGWVTSMGATLLLLATLQLCMFNQAIVPPLRALVPRDMVVGLFPFLLHASVCCLVAVSTRFAAARRLSQAETSADLWRPTVAPLTMWALVTSSLAVLPALLFWLGPTGWHAACTFWIAAVWLVVAVLRGWKPMFWAFHALATAGLCLAVTACFEYGPYSRFLFGLPHVFSQLAALAVWSAVWSVVRRDARQWPWLHDLMTPAWPAVDRLCLYAALTGVLVIAVATCLPGIDTEVGAYAQAESGWGGNASVLLRTFDFLRSQGGTAAALMLAMFLLWSLGALLAWSLGAFRRSRQAMALLVLAALGMWLVWCLARVGIFTWQFDDTSLRFAATGNTWRLLLVVAVAVAVSFLNRVSTIDLVGLVCLAFAVPLLCAAWFTASGGVTAVLAWGLAVCGLAVAATVWARKALAVFCVRRGWISARPLRAIPIIPLSALALVLSSLPVVLISLAHILPLVEGRPVELPAFHTFTGQVRLLAVYCGPLIVLAATLCGYAVRERSPAFALSGSLIINAAVTVASLLLVWLPGQGDDILVVVRLVQWSGLTLGLVGLAWLAGRQWIEAVAAPGESRWPRWFGVPLDVQVALLLLASAVLTVWAVFVVVVFPAHLPASAQVLSNVQGWCILVLAAAVGGGYIRTRLPGWDVHLAGYVALSAVALAAAGTHDANGPDNWLAFHVLSGGWLLVAALATALTCVGTVVNRRNGSGDASDAPAIGNRSWLSRYGNWSSRAARGLAMWATAVAAVVVLLAIRDNWFDIEWSDPYQPWWPAFLAGAAAVIATALSLRDRSQPYAYASVVLAALATAFVGTTGVDLRETEAIVVLLQAMVTAIAASSLVWVAVEIGWQRQGGSVFDSRPNRVPVHHTSAVLAVAAVSLLLGIFLSLRMLGTAGSQTEATIDGLLGLSGPAGWWALAVVALLLVASLWDRMASHALPALYAWGLATAATVVHRFDPSAATAVFGIGMATGIYVLVTGLLWAASGGLVAVGRRFGVPDPHLAGPRVARWLPAGNMVLAAIAMLIAVGGAVLFEALWMRLCVTGAVAIAAVGVALLTNTRQRQVLQHTALALGGCAVVALGWAVMTPVAIPDWLPREFWLPRTIRLMVMLAATVFTYAVVLPRILPRTSDWLVSIRRVAVAAGSLAGATLLLVLLLEMIVFDPTATAPAWQIAIVAAALVALIVALIALAVQKDRDPLGLSDRGRMGYVYAAEVVAALLFLHIYLTMPALFGGIFLPYWPFIVTGIAFAAVGAGEFLDRSGQKVLSQPLTHTGAFLPLLPALGFWVGFTNPTMLGFASVLFLIGLLYVLLSIWRRSFSYVVLAALAGNATLWVLLTDFGVTVLLHPQFFMIPPALCVLVAVQLNQDRLTEAQQTSARYLGLLTIYVASTGEMFLTGLGDHLWPPMLLASLSVMGALAGMMLRIRAFVYLGASFLMLSILSMVWHAAQNIGHSWPWWAFGIALGILMVTMFGIFEKKRQDVCKLIETFRGWEG